MPPMWQPLEEVFVPKPGKSLTLSLQWKALAVRDFWVWEVVWVS